MKTALLFAGQGSQHAGMGKDLYEKYDSFRKAFDSASLPFDLHEVCFEDKNNVISQTKFTQPCMVAFATGCSAVLKENGFTPDFTAGLSLGEYSALEAAGVFDAKTAIETVAFRGQAMVDAAKGIESGMTAVLGLEHFHLQKCCDEASRETGKSVSICNYNCPGQLVIGGEINAVQKASALATDSGARKCIPLSVSGPFHTSYMKSAGDKLNDYFKTMVFGKPQISVMYNFLGSENTNNFSIPDLLVQQVQNSVKMESIIREMLISGVKCFVEIGPGKALSGFVKKTAKDMNITDYTCFGIETLDDMEAFLAAKE